MMTKQKDPLAGREVIFEFRPIGHYIKITAMDAQSLTEVSTQAPAGLSEAQLKSLGRKRLAYTLRKKGLI
jgi:hypothetical protein